MSNPRIRALKSPRSKKKAAELAQRLLETHRLESAGS